MNNGTPMGRMAARSRVSVDPAKVAGLKAREIEVAAETVAEVQAAVEAQTETLESLRDDLTTAQGDIEALQTP